MNNLIMYKKGEDSWVRWIKKRINNNLNFIALFQGAPGIGKTWSAISLGQRIDPEFDIKQIVFDFKELMNLINEEWFLNKKWKIIIFDEPQITISNRQWQSTTNKMMNYLLSTFRHQNVILFFCSPYVDFLDSQSMKLLHCIFECVGVNKLKGLSRIRPKIQQYNASMKKTYQHPLYVIHKKKTIPLRDWYIPKPTEEIVELYEKKKTDFTSELNKEIQEKLVTLTQTKENTKMTFKEAGREALKETFGYDLKGRKPLTKKQEQALRLLVNNTTQKTAEIMGVNITAVTEKKMAALRKGYSIEEFKEEVKDDKS